MCTDRSNGKWVLIWITALGVYVNHCEYRQVRLKVGTHPDYSTRCLGKYYVYRQVKWKVGTHPDYSTQCLGKSL